jgi:hypothetical protein
VERLTTNTASTLSLSWGSTTGSGPLIDTIGRGSASSMVTTPGTGVSGRVAFVAAVRVAMNTSGSSSRSSGRAATGILRMSAPGGKVSVPLAGAS